MGAQGVQESQIHGRTVSYHIQNLTAQHLFSQGLYEVRGDQETLMGSWREVGGEGEVDLLHFQTP